MTGLYTRHRPATRRQSRAEEATEPGRAGIACYPPWVTRPRTSAPRPDRPGRHRSFWIPGRLLPLVAAVALLAAACGAPSGTAAPIGSGATGAAGSAAGASDTTSASVNELATPVIEPSATPAPTEVPSASSGVTASPAVAPASGCSGTDENRTFFSSVAASTNWVVYCPVLPAGWFVEQGQYRLAGGGRLAMTYRGPGGGRFTLDEGVWCTDGSGCVPAGSDIASTAFGDRTGTLIATGSGSFAIVVDAGATVSWSLAGEGLDESTVRTFGAALIAVGG